MPRRCPECLHSPPGHYQDCPLPTMKRHVTTWNHERDIAVHSPDCWCRAQRTSEPYTFSERVGVQPQRILPKEKK